MKFIRRNSVAFRLLKYIIAFSSLITLILTIFQLSVDYRRDIDLIEDRLTLIKEVNVDSFSNSFWRYDLDAMKVLAQGLHRYPDMQYLEIASDEEILISIGTPKNTNAISEKIPLIHVAKEGEVYLGDLLVVFTLENIQSRLWETALIVLLSNAVKTFIVAGFILFIVHNLVTKHLVRIADYANDADFSKGRDPLNLVRLHGDDDELCKVVQAINSSQKVTLTAVQTLRESEDRYKEASHIANLGHWVFDVVADKLVHCSDELASIHGVSSDVYVAMISSTEKDIERVHPDDRGIYAKVIKDAQKDAKSFDVEYRIIRPDGEVRHLREIGEPVVDDTGKLIQERGTIQDISDRKQLERQLRHSQRMEAVGQLTGGVAHDFNNLLAIMLGNAELLEDVAGEDKEAKTNIEAIKAAVDRASSLTGRLLAFSRQSPLAPVSADIGELIGGVNDMLQRALGETVELKVVDTEGLWPATTDIHQFENALINLTLNARDAMPQGGMLAIETANVTLDETYAEQYEEVTPGDYVRISVSDTGTGILPDKLAKVFEPFLTTKEVGKGSGLGLSMVFGFVKQSSGHITIYSEVGLGTSVKLYIPRSHDGQSEKEVKNDAMEQALGSERILIVEDDPDVRKIPAAILRDQGYEVVEATNGEDATQRLQDGPPFDLLFTDIVLPGGMDGVEIAEQAQKLQTTIKVLYATGYAENANVQISKMVASGMLVNKPYLRAELLEKVRFVLDREID